MTRPRSGSGEDRLSYLLRERGAIPLHLATTRTTAATDPDPLRRAAAHIADYDWLVVTSARAVPALMEALTRAGVPAEDVRGGGTRICAVGPRTAEALGVAGLSPDIVPDRYLAEGVVSALAEVGSLDGARVLLPRAEEGREVIPKELRALGASVEVAPAYRTEADVEECRRLAALVAGGGVDVLTFTAGSAARSFAAAWSEHGPFPPDVGVVALGPATAEVLVEEELPVHQVADPHTLEGLIEALERWCRGRGRV